LSSTARASLSDDFDRIGLQIVTFQVEAITPPDEVTKLIDQRTGMGAIGDMGAFTQFQAAQAMRDAAQNPSGGGAATGVGLGAGMAMGQAMANAINQSQKQGGQGAAGAGNQQGMNFCPNCGNPIPAGAKFCPHCGFKLSAD
jgi:membrane protease subunit (stomatin/prohibitin family)